MKAPAIDSAVHTTPPMMSAATMPPVPFSPTAESTTEIYTHIDMSTLRQEILEHHPRNMR